MSHSYEILEGRPVIRGTCPQTPPAIEERTGDKSRLVLRARRAPR